MPTQLMMKPVAIEGQDREHQKTMWAPAVVRRLGWAGVAIASLLIVGSGTPELRGQSADEGNGSEKRRIGVGDTIRIDVFREASLTGTFPVGEQGTISYPLLGKVPVEGLTVDEVESELEARLETNYLRDAEVSIAVIGRRAFEISVLGHVNAPGRIQFEAGERMDLFSAVVSAGGVREGSNPAAIELKRRDGETIETIRLNLDQDRSFVLQPGDAVIVPQLAAGGVQVVTILGEVGKPGTVEIPPGRDLDILTAIAQAGGLAPTARPSRVTLRRNEAAPLLINLSRVQRGEEESIVLKPGDTIFVPESIF